MCRTILHIGLLSLLAIAGCGAPARPRVEGKVTVDGKPAANQTLTLSFVAQAGESFDERLPLSSEGTFSAEVPATGKYKVAVEPSLAALEGRGEAAKGQVVVPAKYRNKATTDLEWEIKAGLNQRDFDLK